MVNDSKVIKFNSIIGNAPVGTGDADKFWDQLRLQASLVVEEAKEQLQAVMERDVVEVLDGACDVMFLQTYMNHLLNSVGINFPEAFNSVCEDNAKKYTSSKDFAKGSQNMYGFETFVDSFTYGGVEYFTVRRSSDNKVLKLLDHERPDLSKFIPSIHSVLE